MTKPTDILQGAFAKSAARSEEFGEGHKLQLDKLKEVVEQINADGVFSAQISSFTTLQPDIPMLSVENKADGAGQSYFIEFGFEAFSGSATLKLGKGLGKEALGGREEGFNLEFEQQQEAMLKFIGADLGEKSAKRRLGTEALKYTGSGAKKTL
ncbi:MAG: hypothetical protein EA357_08070 [Micavibrio sp.]|nr:MAG: hypothetical protein EA357_08070 [Micavibrio sp.]